MIQKIDIRKIKENKDNPRYIRDNKFKKLVKSIKEFPEMLEFRPIIVDENMTSYIEMYNWVELLTEGRSNTTTDIVPLNKVSHEADISVLLMTNSNKVVKTIKYIDCVPTSIGSLSFSSSSSEAAQVNFNASFRAEYFVIT